MKKNYLFLALFLCPMVLFGQLKVQTNGDTYASKNIYIGSSSNFLGTSTTVPIVFKVNNVLAGTTGAYSSNVSFGYNALSSSSLTGYSNTAFGSYALQANTSGYYNTVLGASALCRNTTGANNVAIGCYTLSYNTTGSNNTAIGFNCAMSSANYTNSICIGYYSGNTASNQVRIGNSSITSIGGYAGWSNISDGRVKKNVRAEVPGLAFINLLQPVTYNLDLDAIDKIQRSDDPVINKLSDSIRSAQSPKEKEMFAKAKAIREKQIHTGFVAQDVEKAAKSIGYEFSGIDAPENDKSTYGLRYAEFVVPLVKAVQELSEQNNKMQEQINELTAKLDKLTNAQYSSNAGVLEVANNFSFTLFPNPTNNFVTIDYTLNVDAPICIELYNLFGQRMKLIVPQQNQKAGAYNVQISVGDLGTGTYIVKTTSGKQIESKQLIISH